MDEAAEWIDLGVPYRIGPTNTLFAVDAVLSVQEGCEFVFESQVEFRVNSNGAITAIGSAENPIRFSGTTPQPGHWDGINIYQSNAAANHLAYVIVEHAGYDAMYYADRAAGIAVTTNGSSSRCTIDHTTIRNNSGYGLCVDTGANPSGFSNNTITGNTSGAVYLYADAVPFLDSESVYSGNLSDEICINVAAAISEAGTWRFLGSGIFHRITPGNDELNVNAGLTIEPGCTLAFETGSGIQVSSIGYLNANGTETAPIVFTGTTQTAGWWRGINYYRTNYALNSLSYALVEYAGSSAWGYADMSANISIVTYGDPAQVSVTSCSISDGAGAGIWIDAEAVVNEDIQTSNTFETETLTGGAVVDTRTP